jgi:aminopeptidase N
VSGKDLKPFFDQWLRTRGIPKLRLEKKRLGNTTTLKVIQAGAPYQLLMTIGLVSDGGHVVKQKIPLISAETEIKLQGINTKVILDPDTELLFEEVK